MKYCGMIMYVTRPGKLSKNYYCTWDEHGKCINPDRPDCYILIPEKV
jgi:hypothetical protein